MELGPFSLSADWFRIALSNQPALSSLTPQSIIDQEAEGRLPAGVTVIRHGDNIELIRGSSYVNAGENDVAGFNVQGNMDWKTDWADVVFAAYWSHLTEDEVRSDGNRVPYDYPRNRVHALLRASRSGVTASWSALAVSGYSNRDGTGRYKSWMGHNVTIRWRHALGVRGMDLAGGILNIGNRGPSATGIQEQVDKTLDSTRGRTFFLTAKISFDP